MQTHSPISYCRALPKASLLAALLLLASCSEEKAPARVVGVHHLGEKFTVYQYYLWGTGTGGMVGDEGGGAGYSCCVAIPLTWRPDLFIDVRWEVRDWRNPNREELKRGEKRSISPKMYIARVPIDQYLAPATLYVHFFKNGKVRLVSTPYDVISDDHPVKWGEYDDAPGATQGAEVTELFSQAELDAMQREEDDNRRKYGYWH